MSPVAELQMNVIEHIIDIFDILRSPKYIFLIGLYSLISKIFG